MQRQYIQPAGWQTPPGYSHAVTTTGGPLLVVSGQVSLDPSGVIVGLGDFEAQTVQCFENLRTVLAAGGASFADVIKLTYFIVGINKQRMQAVRDIRDRYLTDDGRPASSAIGVAGLFSDEVLIEIEAIAELSKATSGR
jgi:enamine deaminase RidA (YjgF/YER057c/UK114 family)